MSTWKNELPEVATTSVCVPRVSSICLLPVQETLQDQQVGLTQAPLKSLPLPWVLEHVRFCVRSLRVESVSHSPLGLPKVSLAGLQSQMFWGLLFLVQDPRTGEPSVGLRLIAPC